MLRDADEHFGGDYLNEETMLKMARAKGYSTAAIGKLGPTLIFDHTDKIGTDGLHSIVIDDSTGGKNGVPLSQEMKAAMAKASLPLATPARGDNGKAGDFKTPAPRCRTPRSRPISPTSPPKWCCRCSRRATSRSCWCSGRGIPTAASTINGDSLNTVTPGINGPTSMAGIKNADNNLAQLRKALDDLGLAATTNIIVSSDHGFSTISKESKTSPSAKVSYRRHAEGFPADGLSRDRSRQGARAAAVRSERQERARSPTMPIPRPATACSARIPPSPISWSPPMAGRT